jgi:DNA polymerase-3 subunit delta'
MQFSDIYGHDHLKDQLKSMVSHNRLSHALLFSGKEGSGALPMAMAFAQYIVCEKNKPSAATPVQGLFGEELNDATENQSFMADSCGKCSACVKSATIAHPDIHYSFPVIPLKSGTPPVSADFYTKWRAFLQENPYNNVYDWLNGIDAENKQGNITARECEEILQKLSLKSFESGYKILIMWMPESLGKEGNKLLKMIEEPPPDTLFILVAEDEARILPTILSRTQLVKIPAFENADIEKALVQNQHLSAEKARSVAAISDGNYREALMAVQHAEEDWLPVVRDWMNAVARNGPVAQVKIVDDLSKHGREKQKQFLKYVIHLLEESIRLSVFNGKQEHLHEQERDFTAKLNKLTAFQQQEAMIRELEQAIYYVERNANAKLLFMALTIKFSHLIKYNSLILIN